MEKKTRARATIRAEAQTSEMPAPGAESGPVLAPYREFVLFYGHDELEFFSGPGLTLDDVIGHCNEMARDLWRILDRENQREDRDRLRYRSPEKYCSEGIADQVIVEAGRVKAVLRFTVEARPNWEVVRFDPPAVSPPVRPDATAEARGLLSVWRDAHAATIARSLRDEWLAARAAVGDANAREDDVYRGRSSPEDRDAANEEGKRRIEDLCAVEDRICDLTMKALGEPVPADDEHQMALIVDGRIFVVERGDADKAVCRVSIAPGRVLVLGGPPDRARPRS